MKDTVFIVCNANGATRMTKKLPSVKAGEIVVQLALSVNNDAFRTPIASAVLDVSQQHVIRPVVHADVEPPVYEPHDYTATSDEDSDCEICGEGVMHYYHEDDDERD